MISLPVNLITPRILEFPDKAVFDTDKAMKKYNRRTDWRKIIKGPEMDDEDDQRKKHYQEKEIK